MARNYAHWLTSQEDTPGFSSYVTSMTARRRGEQAMDWTECPRSQANGALIDPLYYTHLFQNLHS